MQWDWGFVAEVMPTLLQGLKVTILGAVLAAALGLAFAIARRSRIRPLARGAGVLVECVRGTPLLVQLHVIFHVLPDVGLRLPPPLAGVIGMGLHDATHASGVYRA